MSKFAMAVELYMTSPVHSVREDDTLRDVERRLQQLAISSLAVVDAEERLKGVISRTDLLRVGRRQGGIRADASSLTLPGDPVARHMTRDVITIAPGDPVAKAAREMVEHRVHRVFVEEDRRPVGVLSTRDLMLAIRDKRVNSPISESMSSPVFTVRAEEPISLAVERLEKARVTGLVVVDDGWPVGLFTQREALESRDCSRDTLVDAVMSPAMLALATDTRLHRAAAQSAALRVRRVIAVRDRQMEGILTGLDFARVAT